MQTTPLTIVETRMGRSAEATNLDADRADEREERERDLDFLRVAGGKDRIPTLELRPHELSSPSYRIGSIDSRSGEILEFTDPTGTWKKSGDNSYINEATRMIRLGRASADRDGLHFDNGNFRTTCKINGEITVVSADGKMVNGRDMQLSDLDDGFRVDAMENGQVMEFTDATGTWTRQSNNSFLNEQTQMIRLGNATLDAEGLHFDDGLTRTTLKTDGTKITQFRDGTRNIERDGSYTTERNGVMVTKTKEGDIITESNGVKKTLQRDGTYITEKDGQRITEKDGLKVIEEADGTMITVNQRGRFVVWPDGTRMAEWKSGLKETFHANGTVCRVYPDGKSTDQFPDGTIRTTWSNGNSEISYPNGVKVVSNQDSRIVIYADGHRVIERNNMAS